MQNRHFWLRPTSLLAGALAAVGIGVGAGSAGQTKLPSTAVAPPLTVDNASVASGIFAIRGTVSSSSGGVGLSGYGSSSTLRQYGVFGSSFGPKGSGVYGRSYYVEPPGGPSSANSTTGVYGAANNGYGIEGATAVQNSQTSGLFAGVLGVDSTANFGNNDGVLGLTTNGYFGVQGIGGAGSVGGVYGTAADGNYGVFGSSGGVGVEGASDATPLAAANGAGTIVWSVNSTGVVTAIAAARGGESARTFVPSSTTPLLEDVGSATLVHGTSTVRLDPAFGSSISNAVYQVFVTPNGESNGLYVTQKTSNQFVVRENAGGHSTISFDYRIVAKPFADKGVRIALARSARDFETPGRSSSSSNKASGRLPSSATDQKIQDFLFHR